MMAFAEPVIGPARGPHRARAMGLPRFGPDPLAQLILRAANPQPRPMRPPINTIVRTCWV